MPQHAFPVPSRFPAARRLCAGGRARCLAVTAWLVPLAMLAATPWVSAAAFPAAAMASTPNAPANQPSVTLPIPPFDLAPSPSPSASPSPAPAEQQPAPAATPSAAATPPAQPSPTASVPAPAASPALSPQAPGSPAAIADPSAASDAQPVADTDEAQTAAAPLDPPAAPDEAPEPALPASSALGESIMPQAWPWLTGGLVALAVTLGVIFGLRRRKPKVLRLAAAPAAAEHSKTDSEAAPARLDYTLDIISAARSVMMFTLEYRLEIANRSPRAVRDVTITTRLGYPGRTGETEALAASAEDIQAIERIGPSQSRSITGRLRLPLSEIAPIRQGAAPLLIPLLHILIQADGRPADKRVFVAGPASPQNMGRLQPIRLDGPPGGIVGIRALPVNAPGN